MSKSLGLTTATNDADNLFGGDHPPVSMPIVMTSGQNLVRGTVLGRVTATGKYAAYDDDGDDNGCRTAVCILGEDCDASAGEEKTFAYFHGEFLESALTGFDAAARIELEKSIWVK